MVVTIDVIVRKVGSLQMYYKKMTDGKIGERAVKNRINPPKYRKIRSN